MTSFLKTFGKGLLYTLLSPVIVLIWVLYSTYLVFIFIFEFFKNTILFFMGRDSDGDLKEDQEARRMILEDEKLKQQAEVAMSAMFQNVASQMNAQQTSTPLQQPTFEINQEQVQEEKQNEPVQQAHESENTWENPYQNSDDENGGVNND